MYVDLEIDYEENCAVLQKKTNFLPEFSISILISSSVARMRKREKERVYKNKENNEG